MFVWGQARDCRARFLKTQRFPCIGKASSYVIAPRTACFFKLVQALAIAQLLKGPGRLANLTVVANTHTKLVRDDEGCVHRRPSIQSHPTHICKR